MRKPVIGVTTDVVEMDGHQYHACGDKYLRPIVAAAGCVPRLLPSLGAEIDVDGYLAGLDGILFTGAVSNIESHHYGGSEDDDCPPFDPARDATTLPLIRACLSRRLPLLAICRGLQELNVALGGSLFPRLHDIPGRLDHRARKGRPLDEQYAAVHSVRLTPGGRLHALAGSDEILVNSLHWQAIDRLGDGLVVEAAAPDGTIEAVRVDGGIGGAGFALGVQWHPEWRFAENPVSTALFAAFGEAARGFA